MKKFISVISIVSSVVAFTHTVSAQVTCEISKAERGSDGRDQWALTMYQTQNVAGVPTQVALDTIRALNLAEILSLATEKSCTSPATATCSVKVEGLRIALTYNHPRSTGIKYEFSQSFSDTRSLEAAKTSIDAKLCKTAKEDIPEWARTPRKTPPREAAPSRSFLKDDELFKTR